MKTHCSFKNPDEMEVSVTVEMSLAQWRHLRKQLGSMNFAHYSEAGRLSSEIESVISKVEKTFRADVPEQPQS